MPSARRTIHRISAGRSALWFAGRGAEGLLPHQAGAVGDLLLGQTGDGSHPARPAGRTVYLAGQTGVDATGKIAEGFRAQAVQVMENLKTALASVGIPPRPQ
jgi:enamine deaminase RidA (YjgF/YER057c/UK114 family)